MKSQKNEWLKIVDNYWQAIKYFCTHPNTQMEKQDRQQQKLAIVETQNIKIQNIKIHRSILIFQSNQQIVINNSLTSNLKPKQIQLSRVKLLQQPLLQLIVEALIFHYNILNNMLEAEESEWSLSSVELQQNYKNIQEDENSFSHTTLQEQYSYESKHPPTSKPVILPDTPLNPIGNVVSIVQDFIVVQAENNRVIDLESYLLNKNRQIVGYVVDVLGPVGHHYYAVKQVENHAQVGDKLFFCEGCRVLNQTDIQKLKTIGIVNDNGSDQEENKHQIPKGAFKRDREQSVDMQRGRTFPRQPSLNLHGQFNGQWFGNMGQHQPMNACLGQFIPQPAINYNFMYPINNSNTGGAVVNNGSNIPPMSPEQMMMMNQMYQNCYNSTLFNQKK